MAHFAQLDENNVVLTVIVVSDADCLDENGVESEQVGIDFCKSLFGEDTIWKQTSYNANQRKNYAPIGGSYYPEHDCFAAPQPFSSWTLNGGTCQWEPPVPVPDVNVKYDWNEETQQWDDVSQPWDSVEEESKESEESEG